MTHVETAMDAMLSASDLTPSSSTVHLDQLGVQPVPPVTIVMRGFISWKIRNVPWYSPPFYSHAEGYKMCIRVTDDSLKKGTGVHISVFVHLMQGEYDADLVWPFRGTITLQLVNHRNTKQNLKHTVQFDNHTCDDYSGPVRGNKIASAGWGYDFISLKSKDTEYLKDDSVEIRVTQIKVLSLF